MGWPAFHGAPDWLTRAQDLFDGATECSRHRSWSHRTGNGNYVVERQIATVFDILLSLAISGWLFQSFNYQRSRRRHNRNSGLSILNGQLNCDFQTFPITGSLGDVVTNFFGRLKCENSSLDTNYCMSKLSIQN